MFSRSMPVAATAVMLAVPMGGCGGGGGGADAADAASRADAPAARAESSSSPDDGGAEDAPEGQNAAGGAGRISAIGNAFAPATVTVEAGDTITFTNQDGATHTATADGVFDLELAPGSTREWVAKRRGEYSFLCTIHAGMAGHISVQ
jgi:plastocyanin